ncbi:MAG: NapC/NirT family cytochrome c [Acidobacteria bacterium]|nr:NapC/NirT family cytochrome c [Acidobacteriota bacterium]
MRKLPFLRHPISFSGALLSLFSATLFLIFFVAESMGWHTNPYMGMVFFIILPGLFLAGLGLIPLGVWRQHRRVATGKGELQWPTLNLNSPRHRKVTALVLVITVLNVVIVSLAAYSGLHYMDSTEFCGTVCHEVMEPQHLAFQNSAHARVGCVQCHIGPGASWFVQSKLSGTRQIFAVTLNTFSRPIPSPVHDLRPARETCEQCHWPEKFHGDKVLTRREYGDDEANTVTETTLQMHVGGGSDLLRNATGIHWHTSASSTIEYVATDEKREVIPWVKVTYKDGTVREYVAEGAPTAEELAAGERRQMDCVDCHNRAGHPFANTPERAVNAALDNGEMPANLPFARREAVGALSQTYDSKAAALDAIAVKLRGFYRTEQAEAYMGRRQDVERVVNATQAIYRRSVFPSMKIGFGTYSNNIGHMDFPGCFRCHDDNHKTKDGLAISQSCDLCHDIR